MHIGSFSLAQSNPTRREAKKTRLKPTKNNPPTQRVRCTYQAIPWTIYNETRQQNQ